MHSAHHTGQPAPKQSGKSLAFGLLYYAGVRCPGCGSTQWHVGRSTAECPRCATAMVIAEPVSITLQGAN